MNGVNSEAKTKKVWASKRPHSKLRLVVTMVSHGI
jgi:hypothetical protein